MQWSSWVLACCVLTGCGGRSTDSVGATHDGPEGAGGSGAGGGMVLLPPPPPPPDPGLSCAAIEYAAESVPTSMLLLMTAGARREFYMGLTEMVTSAYAADVTLALGFFDSQAPASSACDSGFEPAARFTSAAGFLPLIGPALAQETRERRAFGPALEGALSYMMDNAPTGSRRLVVVGAGSEPSGCNSRDEAALSALTARYREAGVDAALIGTEYQLATNRTLTAPFEPALFVPTSSVEWQLVKRYLLELAGKSPGCTLSLPAPPEGDEYDYDLVNVQLRPYGTSDAEALFFVGHADACAEGGREGWYYDETTNPRRIRLCDATCDRTPGSTLTVAFGCAPPPLPR